MARMIDIDDVERILWDHHFHDGDGLQALCDVAEILEAVREHPEAVDIVRCKDCKYAPINLGTVCSPENIKWRDARYFAGEDSEACPYNCGDPWYSVMPEPHWYCWKGKRKEQ